LVALSGGAVALPPVRAPVAVAAVPARAPPPAPMVTGSWSDESESDDDHGGGTAGGAAFLAADFQFNGWA
jgi:hypothetical protein